MSGEGAVAAYPLIQEEGRGAIPTSPLQFVVEEINMREACDLNRQWHSMLPRTNLGNMYAGRTSVAYGALCGGKWYAVGIWTQPIIASLCDGKTIELRRLAICQEAPKNTASWMLSRMRKTLKAKWPFLKLMISYQAVDVHEGTIYKASGWRIAGKVVDARPQRLSGSKQRATGPLQTQSRKVRWEKKM